MYIEFIEYKHSVEPCVLNEDELGVKYYTQNPQSPFRSIFEVINKQKFFLGLIKYGLGFKEILDLDKIKKVKDNWVKRMKTAQCRKKI